MIERAIDCQRHLVAIDQYEEQPLKAGCVILLSSSLARRLTGVPNHLAQITQSWAVFIEQNSSLSTLDDDCFAHRTVTSSERKEGCGAHTVKGRFENGCGETF